MMDDQDFVELHDLPPQSHSNLNLVTYVDNDVSISEWVVMLLLLCIPLVNIILPFIWAFDSSAKPSKSNFFKAYLIFLAVFVVLGVFCAIIFGSIFSSLMTGSANPASFY